MNLQQVMPPKSSANGFGRRKGERDSGTRLDSKLQPGKSNCARVTSIGAMIVGKSGSCDSPSHDRLLFITTCLIGHAVEVQVKNGSIYSGIFHATSDEKEFGVVLKMARLIKEGTFRGHRAFAEFAIKAPSQTFIIPANELVHVTAKEVAVPRDGMANELQHDKQQELMIDSTISQSHLVDVERELEPWIPDENDPQLPELDNIFDGPWNRNWDQFETNETLFGVTSTFNEELYTTKLLRGPQTKELEREATRIAREIEGEDTQDLHLAEERGINLLENFDSDEEARFSSVYRGTGFDDGRYEEDEDIMLDSMNNETFGDSSGSVNMRSTDLIGVKSNDGAQLLSGSSSLVDEARSCQSGTVANLYCSVPHDHAGQMVSEIPNKSFSTVDSESRVQENLLCEHGENSDVKSSIEKQLPPEDAQLSKLRDSHSSQGSETDGSGKAAQSMNLLAYAPSHVLSKPNDKTSSPGVPLEATVSSKVPGESQSVISRARPSSSASSNSDCAAAAPASTATGLSPSSSMGSLSSEKTTLNPHAKEFKLNPNAKSFIPSQASARPLSPVADSAFYLPPNVSGVPHIPVGLGIGPSFAGHQPVLYNPQIAQMQSSQAYYHPHGPQYGQQILVGQQRPVFYMPSYQPDMQYKGRDY